MNNRAQKIINGIIAAPFLLLGAALVVALLYFVYCEVNKAYWDSKVREWCEKDGGVVVFEKVELTKNEFKNLGGNQYGQIPLSVEKLTKHDYPYYSEYKDILLHKGVPSVYRYESTVFRKSNRKPLGMMINYGRGGGDFPTGILHPSHFGCADLKTIRFDIEKQIFIAKGE